MTGYSHLIILRFGDAEFYLTGVFSDWSFERIGNPHRTEEDARQAARFIQRTDPLIPLRDLRERAAT